MSLGVSWLRRLYHCITGLYGSRYSGSQSKTVRTAIKLIFDPEPLQLDRNQMD
jgi:hypothetical protein